VAAPNSWFRNRSYSREWDYILEHYNGLAQTFDITLGAILLDG